MTSDDALHVVGYFGDADGDAGYSAIDIERITRVAAGLDSGFSAWPLTDPVVMGELNASGKVTGSDTHILQKEMTGKDQPGEIPALPPQDAGRYLVVKSFAPTDSGFKVRFNHNGVPATTSPRGSRSRRCRSTVIGIGDIMRGPGEDAAAEDGDGGPSTNLPVTFSSLGGVKSIAFIMTTTRPCSPSRAPSAVTICRADARIAFEKLALDDGKARVRVTLTSSKVLPAGTPSSPAWSRAFLGRRPAARPIVHIAVKSINGASAVAASGDGVHVVGLLGDGRRSSRDADGI